MKISRVYFFLVIVSIVFISCSSDNENQNQNDDQTIQEPVITSYIYTYRGEPNDPNIAISESFYLGSIQNNRKQNSTREHFFDGVSQGIFDQNLYEYNSNDYLMSFNKDLQLNDDIKEYDYNSNGNAAGLTWTLNGSPQYYRFVHSSSNITYFERISLPYNDPNTVAGTRYILEFDNNDNVIKAGRDSNFDDIMDYENIYTYDSNNNMINVQVTNGDNVTFSYSTIINTLQYLEDKTFGKKLARLINSEIYGHNNVAEYLDGLLEMSYNLTIQAATESDYEVLENNFYSKKTRVGGNNTSLTETYTSEFIFE